MRKLIVDTPSMMASLLTGSMTREEIKAAIDPSCAVRKSRKDAVGYAEWSTSKRISDGRMIWSRVLLGFNMRAGYIVLRDERYHLTTKAFSTLIRDYPEAFTDEGLESVPEPLRTAVDRVASCLARREIPEQQEKGMRVALTIMIDYCLEIGCFSESVVRSEVYEGSK